MAGKLIFMHGVMSAGKSSTLIQKAFQFTQCGKQVLVFRPIEDTRAASDKVVSRIGISWPAIPVCSDDNLLEIFEKEEGTDIILVDESNFFTEKQMDELADIADIHGKLVIAFGLKNDFAGSLFDSTRRLFELADRIDELPSMCTVCGSKATHHYRKIESDEQFVVGDDIYMSVCRKCFKLLNK